MSYPDDYDDVQPVAPGSSLAANDAAHAAIAEAINRLQQTLGLVPGGAHSTVRERIEALETQAVTTGQTLAVSTALLATAQVAFADHVADPAAHAAGGFQAVAERDQPDGYLGLDVNGFVDPVHVPVSWTNELDHFGDGGDGDVTITTETFGANRAFYYENFTISGAGVWQHQHNPVFVAGTLTVTTSAPVAIKHSVNVNQNGGDAPSGTSGSGGVPRSTNVVASWSPGVNGPGGAGAVLGAAVSAGAVTAAAFAAGGAGGTGGSGGASAVSPGQVGRVPGGITTAVPFYRPTYDFVRGITLIPGGHIGAAGASGAGNGTQNGGGGGGGPPAGSMGYLGARVIDVSGYTGIVFSVSPGTSGNGASPSGTNCGGGGGAAGAGGGFLCVVHGQVLGSLVGAFRADGGTGGNGGDSNGTGTGGGGGGGGSAGRILVFDTRTSTTTLTEQTTAPGGPGAPSGITGGVGGAGGICRHDLVEN